jgi:predicted RNA-binding protein YlqC (UPF0109 family)
METNQLDEFETFGSQLIQIMCNALVDHPEAVQVTVLSGEKTTVFQVIVAPSDLGQVLGKSGANAGAVRRVLLAYGTRCGRRAIFEILNDSVACVDLKAA